MPCSLADPPSRPLTDFETAFMTSSDMVCFCLNYFGMIMLYHHMSFRII
jgi:hypothetical protein